MTNEIHPQDYQAFKVFLQDACGILLGENKQYLVTSRLRKIMAGHELENLGELVERLRRQPRGALREAVIDAMTTNETLWFRDLHPFRILQDKLLPELVKKGGASLRIWSAACSTGQEPYSVAMCIDEFRRLKPGQLRQNIQIVATDISRTVLEGARKGEYEMLAIGRGLSPERQRQYFTPAANGSWAIKPAIRSMVDFKEINLLERYMLGRFDIIFCRNVLIYFSAEHKKDILLRMHQSLNPGGYLVLGASESLNGLPDKYDMVQCQPGIIYRAK